MEFEITFMNIDTLHSEKTGKDYYKIYYLQEKKPVEEFISKEIYEKIKIKNLKYLQNCKAIFKINQTSRKLMIFDIVPDVK